MVALGQWCRTHEPGQIGHHSRRHEVLCTLLRLETWLTRLLCRIRPLWSFFLWSSSRISAGAEGVCAWSDAKQISAFRGPVHQVRRSTDQTHAPRCSYLVLQCAYAGGQTRFYGLSETGDIGNDIYSTMRRPQFPANQVPSCNALSGSDEVTFLQVSSPVRGENNPEGTYRTLLSK
jgi:hypothetical protein